jgi:hypothetical protein
MRAETPALLSDNEARITLYTANGITGVREMGGDYVDTVFRWRAETAKVERLGPRILSSRPKVEGPKPRLPGSFAITDSSAARAAVNKLSTMGADFVKISPMIFLRKVSQRPTTTRQHRPRRFCLTFRSQDLAVEPQTLLLERRSAWRIMHFSSQFLQV